MIKTDAQAPLKRSNFSKIKRLTQTLNFVMVLLPCKVRLSQKSENKNVRQILLKKGTKQELAEIKTNDIVRVPTQLFPLYKNS